VGTFVSLAAFSVAIGALFLWGRSEKQRFAQGGTKLPGETASRQSTPYSSLKEVHDLKR
jgi:hypothetical protein